MDEKYSEYLSLLPLLNEISTMRQMKYYKKWIKETYRAEMENLRNVEIELYNQKPKLADPTKWPIASDEPLQAVNVQQPIEECHQILAALYCFK